MLCSHIGFVSFDNPASAQAAIQATQVVFSAANELAAVGGLQTGPNLGDTPVITDVVPHPAKMDVETLRCVYLTPQLARKLVTSGVLPELESSTTIQWKFLTWIRV